MVASCCRIRTTAAPVEHLLPVLGQDSVLRRALEQDAGLLFSSVWTLDPGHMGFRLWRRLDARNWKDLGGPDGDLSRIAPRPDNAGRAFGNERRLPEPRNPNW